MGVQDYIKSTCERYPSCSTQVKEQEMPVIDNLYIDFNSMIHKASLNSDRSVLSEIQVIDRVCCSVAARIKFVKPRKMCFFAVDGVAPDAKLRRKIVTARRNQNTLPAIAEELSVERGFNPRIDIKPGTKFMEKLQKRFIEFIEEQKTINPLWEQISFFFSGHDVQGEGEHKIMDFVRDQRSQPDYNPRTRHCFLSEDADAIVLALASHEPFFSILREHGENFRLVYISGLRDYMKFEFSELVNKLPFEYDLDRIIDDTILLGFSFGNDFIPKLPYFEYKRSVLPKLHKIYKEVLPELDGYLTENGQIILHRFQKLLAALRPLEFILAQRKAPQLTFTAIRKKSFPSDRASKMAKLDVTSGPISLLSSTFEYDDVSNSSFDEDGEITDSEIEYDDVSEGDFEFSDPEVDFDDFKSKFYKDNQISVDDLEKVTEDYLNTIQWIYSTYSSGVPSTTWIFQHKFLPFGSDMAEFFPVNLVSETQDEQQDSSSPGVVFVLDKTGIQKFGWNYFKTPPAKQLKGMHPSIRKQDFIPNFSSLNSIKADIEWGVGNGVTVFNGKASKQESIILTILPECHDQSSRALERFARRICGQIVYVGFPNLKEAKVVSASNFREEWGYEDDKDSKSRGTVYLSNLRLTKFDNEKTRQWKAKEQKIGDNFRMKGINIEGTQFLLKVTPVVGEKYVSIQSDRMILEKQFCPYPITIPYQTIVEDRRLHVQNRDNYSTAEVYKTGSYCFNLGRSNYGLLGKVIKPNAGQKGKVHIEWHPKDTVGYEERKRKLLLDPRYVQTSDAEIEPELLSVLICEKEPTEHKTFSSLELSQQLFQPNSKLYTYPDRTTRTNKLDLVVNVSDCSPVPLGLQGTVIGIKRANHPMDDIFKVLFAMPFFGGLPVPMGSHEPIHCIHSLSPWEFINLSHGDRQGMHLWHQSTSSKYSKAKPSNTGNTVEAAPGPSTYLASSSHDILKSGHKQNQTHSPNSSISSQMSSQAQQHRSSYQKKAAHGSTVPTLQAGTRTTLQAGTRSTMSVIPRPPLKIVARNPSAQGSVQIRPPVPQQSSYDRLAEWMKKKGMGVPIYTFQLLGNGKKRATISLSNGKVLGSGEGQNNPLASESAASIVLRNVSF